MDFFRPGRAISKFFFGRGGPFLGIFFSRGGPFLSFFSAVRVCWRPPPGGLVHFSDFFTRAGQAAADVKTIESKMLRQTHLFWSKNQYTEVKAVSAARHLEVPK